MLRWLGLLKLLQQNPENTVGVFDLWPFYAALLNSQLLVESKVFKNYVLFALRYEPYKLKDHLGKDFQGCFLPNFPIELTLNRYSGSLHKSLKLNKFEFLSRTGFTRAESIRKGAYAELIGIDPKIIQVLLLFPLQRILLFSSFSRPIQPDVIEEHLARTAGDRHVTLGPQSDSDPVNVGQDYALICKGLQRDNPLGPDVDLCRDRIIMDHHCRSSGTVRNRYIQRLGIVAEYADILVRPLRANSTSNRDVSQYGLTCQSNVMARKRQANVDIRTHLDVLCALHRPRGAVG